MPVRRQARTKERSKKASMIPSGLVSNFRISSMRRALLILIGYLGIKPKIIGTVKRYTLPLCWSAECG